MPLPDCLRILPVLVLTVACSDSDTARKQTTRVDDMLFIPAGEFTLGSNKQDEQGQSREFGFIQPLYVDEHPMQKVNLPGFWIDRYEVTNGRFLVFYRQTLGQTSSDEIIRKQQREIPGWADMPVSQVTWFQAQGYCLWAGKRLPTEMEWEKAARGPDARDYPWGNEWDAAKLNAGTVENETGVAKVGSYPSGVSYYGVHDMAGNVAEWVYDWYGMYPGGTYQSRFAGNTHKVVRGGGWGGVGHYVMPVMFRASHRDYEKPDRTFNDIGFRCAKDADG